MSSKSKFLTTIRKADAKKLRAEIASRYEKLRSLRFGLGFGTTASLTELRVAKKELAQLWTVLGEKVRNKDK